jgi:CheY-like chemotaxis protein
MGQCRPEEAAQFMEAAATAAERAAALTHRLLAFSRRQTLDPQAIDINGLVSSMEEMLTRTLGEQVSLSLSLAGDLWAARADTNQMESAILNLAINARDAMPSGGRLTIATSNIFLDWPFAVGADRVSPGDYVLVSVSDSGVGMPASVLAKVFDPFFTTKPIGQGTGLGLSMVHGFVHQSGGAVDIASQPGVGTTVKLYLPRMQTDEAAQPAAGRRAPIPRGEGESVLLVEDDPEVRMLVSSVLSELGYRTIEATESQAAMEVLDGDTEINLLITDVGLPGLDGRQLAEIARERRPDLPVLLVTGYAARASERATFLGPGMRMVSKPFAVDALARSVREILDP